MTAEQDQASANYDHYRADLAHYWARLMWYRDELWRITTPVWGVYGAFIGSCIGYVWSSGKGGIPGEIALMLIFVILAFSWVIQRMYWTYAHRIYEAITQLNHEVQQREQHLYDHFLKNGRMSNYGRFRVYPELNVIFSIVGVALMLASIFTVAAAVGFNFKPAANPTDHFGFDAISMIQLCVVMIFVFEFVLLKFKKHCEVCGEAVVSRPSGKPSATTPAEPPRS
ncbi:MAG: hypothetical protein WAZ34_10570 [Rhodocyclaceae bacterium]